MFMLQKYIQEEFLKSEICDIVSKKAALLILSGFIVLKIFKSIHCYKKLWSIVSQEVLFGKSNINITTKMKVCSKAPPSKNSHHAEASQLTLTEYQMSGLYMTQDITERRLWTDLKITKTVKIY